jgi:hypothetical protein
MWGECLPKEWRKWPPRRDRWVKYPIPKKVWQPRVRFPEERWKRRISIIPERWKWFPPKISIIPERWKFPENRLRGRIRGRS